MQSLVVIAAGGRFSFDKKVFEESDLPDLDVRYDPNAGVHFLLFDEYPLARVEPFFRILKYAQETSCDLSGDARTIRYPLRPEEHLPLARLLADIGDASYIWPIMTHPQSAEDAVELLSLLRRHWASCSSNIENDPGLAILLRCLARGAENLYPELPLEEWRTIWELFASGFSLVKRGHRALDDPEPYDWAYPYQADFARVFRRTGLAADNLFGPRINYVIREAAELLVPAVQDPELQGQLQLLLRNCQPGRLLALPLPHRA